MKEKMSMSMEEFIKWANSKEGQEEVAKIFKETYEAIEELKEERRLAKLSLKDFVVNI